MSLCPLICFYFSLNHSPILNLMMVALYPISPSYCSISSDLHLNHSPYNLWSTNDVHCPLCCFYFSLNHSPIMNLMMVVLYPISLSYAPPPLISISAIPQIIFDQQMMLIAIDDAVHNFTPCFLFTWNYQSCLAAWSFVSLLLQLPINWLCTLFNDF